MEHRPIKTRSGALLQSGTPKKPMVARPLRARGLQLKGVVMATYVLDDPNHFQLDGRTGRDRAVGVYCDVLCYSNIPGMRWRMLPRCMVLQRAGMHDGEIWKPKASTMDITGNELDADGGGNPANFDGDHVLISFVNDNLNEPIIEGAIPHPGLDTGNEESQHRRRVGLRQVDGSPRFYKNHGTYFGVDDNGNWVLDTRYAHDGKLKDDGKEPDPPTDGKGAQTISLPLDAEYTIKFYDMSDPENPEEKVVSEFVKNKWRVKFVDSGLELLVDDENNIIELGEEGSSEKATIDSSLQSELSRIKGDIDLLAEQVTKTRMPLPEFPFPVIFIDMVETFKQPLAYVPGKVTNLRTGNPPGPNHAPLDAAAGDGEYVIQLDPNKAGIYDGGSDVNDTHSDTVKIRS